MRKNQQQNKNQIYRIIAIGMLVCVSTSCNKKEQPTSALVNNPAEPSKRIQVAATQKPLSSVSIKLAPPQTTSQFDFSSKKDPFKPDILIKTLPILSRDDKKKALLTGLPIHTFDVSQFKLIGVVTGSKDNQAMVVDPNGKGYVLKQGMSIGKNDGRVTSISMNGVDVLEQFKDDSGRVRRENIRITLPRKQ